MVAVLEPAIAISPREFANGAEWLAALGNVPLDRIIMNPPPGTATEKDLLRFVERDKRLCELIDGTLVEKPVRMWEGLIAVKLGTILNNFALPRNLGLVFGPDSTMRMKSGRIRLPDISFISMARIPKTRESVPSICGDLVIEVLSESNTAAEMNLKLIEYFQSGTRLAWIVDPQTRTVAIYHQPGEPTRVVDDQASLDGEDVLAGLSFPVAEIFHGVPRGE
jgi:Uma2 family endonuclease